MPISLLCSVYTMPDTSSDSDDDGILGGLTFSPVRKVDNDDEPQSRSPTLGDTIGELNFSPIRRSGTVDDSEQRGGKSNSSDDEASTGFLDELRFSPVRKVDDCVKREPSPTTDSRPPMYGVVDIPVLGDYERTEAGFQRNRHDQRHNGVKFENNVKVRSANFHKQRREFGQRRPSYGHHQSSHRHDRPSHNSSDNGSSSASGRSRGSFPGRPDHRERGARRSRGDRRTQRPMSSARVQELSARDEAAEKLLMGED
ncbi:hypothetical protein HDE_08592 [Halotydeus destructor]|nr:hypothetical protein HDE_08592 [Halotydeus destructor]